jgi:Poly(hydroxyalcanoate) granule associated protein (phasin)
MAKQPTYTFNPYELTEAARHASRQVWLASLGAAVVTRDWVQTEAGPMFKRMVREGTSVESRAIRFVGDTVENSVERANTVWKRTRRTVESSVRQAADTVVGYAQQVYPKSLPIELPEILVKAEKAAHRAVKRAAPKKRVVAKKKAVRARAPQVARKAKRAVKQAAAATA